MSIGTLYKFFKPSEYTYTSLAISSLWFAHVDSFNDPFEGGLQFSFPEYSESAFERVLTAASRIFGDVNLLESERHFLQNNPDGYKRLIAMLKAGMKKLADFNNDNIGVCCFVKATQWTPLRGEFLIQHHDLHKMWCHYGDGLRGFCVEYDGDALIESIKRLNPKKVVTHAEIEYVRHRTLVDFEDFGKRFIGKTDEEVGEIFFNLLEVRNQKGELWRDEKELRLNALNAVNMNLRFDPTVIRSVCFGSKIKPESIEALKIIFSSLGVTSFSTIKTSQVDFSYQVI